MNRPNRPNFDPGWEPRRRAISFGADDPEPARLVRLEGGFVPPPIPQDMFPGPPPGTLPRVLIEQPTSGWWTQAGRFGFKYQDVVPEEGVLIALTESVALPGPPAPLWLNWFRYDRGLFSDELAPAPNFELRGRLIYGVGGAQNTVDVDLISGIQLPIVCNSITVQLLTYNPFAPIVGAPYAAGPVVCGVMFGQGAASGALPATWSSPIFQSAGGNYMDSEYPVPDFARSVAVHLALTDPAQLALTDLAFLSPGGALISVVRLDPALGGYALALAEGGVPIPAGCNSVRLLSPGIPNGSTAQLKFFLAL